MKTLELACEALTAFVILSAPFWASWLYHGLTGHVLRFG
jgi:hypothetical protein